MDSRPRCSDSAPAEIRRPTRSLRFLTFLSVPAVPFDPGEPHRLRFVMARWMAGFTFFDRLATLAVVTRLIWVHAFALRLTPSLLEASWDGSLRHTLDSLHGERIITMISTFQLMRNVKLA